MNKGNRFTEEFRLEAVKQVVERGFGVADVSKRLGVSTHSLYAWIRKYGIPPEQRLVQDDQTAKLKRLEAELRRVTEERDILKKAAVSSTRQCNTFGLIPIKGGVVWRKWVDQVFLLHKNTIYGTDGV